MNEELNQIINDMDERKLLELNSSKIKEYKNNILQKIGFNRSELKHYHKVLKDYKYIDELDELKMGRYLRWVNLTKLENIKLYNGGFLINIEYQNNNIILLCKNATNKLFSIKMSDVVIFQKFITEDLLLIKILDYLHDK